MIYATSQSSPVLSLRSHSSVQNLTNRHGQGKARAWGAGQGSHRVAALRWAAPVLDASSNGSRSASASDAVVTRVTNAAMKASRNEVRHSGHLLAIYFPEPNRCSAVHCVLTSRCSAQASLQLCVRVLSTGPQHVRPHATLAVSTSTPLPPPDPTFLQRQNSFLHFHWRWQRGVATGLGPQA